ASHAVRDQMARGREQKCLRRMRTRDSRRLVHAHVDLLSQIVDLLMVAPNAPQITDERRLVHEDFPLEPAVERVAHSRTIPPEDAEKQRFRRVARPPNASI